MRTTIDALKPGALHIVYPGDQHFALEDGVEEVPFGRCCQAIRCQQVWPTGQKKRQAGCSNAANPACSKWWSAAKASVNHRTQHIGRRCAMTQPAQRGTQLRFHVNPRSIDPIRNVSPYICPIHFPELEQTGLGLAARKHLVVQHGAIRSAIVRRHEPKLSASDIADMEWLVRQAGCNSTVNPACSK